MFHVERIYKCNHAGGQAGLDKRAPQRAEQEQRMPAPKGWARTKSACPQELGKNQECLPPRAWEGSRQGSGAERSCLAVGLPKPLGQTSARLAAPPCRLSWFLPSSWDKQARGLPRHLAGSLGSCPALGTNKRAACRATMQASFVLARPFGTNNRAACRATFALLSSPACPPATHHVSLAGWVTFCLLVEDFVAVSAICFV